MSYISISFGTDRGSGCSTCSGTEPRRLRDRCERRERRRARVDAPVVDRSVLVLPLVEVDHRAHVLVLRVERLQGVAEPCRLALRVARIFLRAPLDERERLLQLRRPRVPRTHLVRE